MKSLSAETINLRAPYHVAQVDSSIFRFVTNNGIIYSVGFVPDTSFLKNGVFQFFLINTTSKSSPQDTNVYETVRVIIEEFFLQEEPVMLYICDTTDKRQKSRDRLFKIWFHTYIYNGSYTMHNECMILDNVPYFSSIILRNDHPFHDNIISAFHEYILEHNQG